MAKIHPALLFRFLLLTLLSSAAWAQLSVTDDTYVSGATPTTVNGSVGSVVVQGSSTGKPSYTYVRFDLTSLGSLQSSQVQKATLKVYVSAVTAAGGFDVYEVQSSTPNLWSESALTWSNGGSTLPIGATPLNGATPISVPYPAGKYEYFVVDVTPAVKDWIGGIWANNGLVLKPHDVNISVSFSSKEDTTYSHDPALNVVIAPGTGTVTSVGTGTGLTGGPIVTSGTISLVPATASALGGVKAPACAAGYHFSGIDSFGALTCTADSITTLNFSAIASGTNSNALTVAGSLTPTGAGTITATSAAFATSAGSANTANSATNSLQLGGILAANFARLDIGNLFHGNQSINGGKQMLAPSAGGYASLNVPNSTMPPSSPAIGDIWLVTVDPHLNFQDMSNTTRTLAFFSDITTANATTLTSANAYTDTKVTAEATARIAGDAATLSSANAHADAGDVSTLAAANSYTNNAVASEATLRAMGDTVEASARASADTTLQGNITAETTRALAAEATKASLSGSNNFTGSNTFSGAKVDSSLAGATLPVQTIMGLPPSGPNVCVAGQMVLQKDGTPGQQLFICNAANDGWVMVNDDTATTAADHAYTDAQVAAEAAARQAADSAITTNLNSEISRAQGAEVTLQNNINSESAARIAADSAEATTRQAADAAEVFARLAGDAATLASAKTYTDTTKTNILTQPQTFSGNETFSGDNSFGGINTFTHKVDLSAAQTLPVQTTNTTPPVSGVPNTCVNGQMLLQINGNPGQQLFICNAANDGWVMVNDDTATTAADHAYTDAQVAAEAAARAAADAAETTRATAAEQTLTTNLSNEVTRATGAETTLQSNINTESAARIVADAALAAAITAETSRATGAETTLQTNIDNLSAASAKLASPNTFTANNTFTGATVDLSHATATLPVQTTVVTPPASGQPNACIDGQMLLQIGGLPGQQLFICNAAHDGWVMVNDDTATTAADHAYTDAQVATEATARIAGDAATLASAKTYADAGDVATLASANGYTNTAVGNEATARAAADSAEALARGAGDAATLALANAYTDAEKTRAMAAEALKANLAGGNNFTGDQSVAGNVSVTGNATVNGTVSLPAVQTNPSTPSASQILNLQGWDGTNATQFQFFVNNSGNLALFTGTGGNQPAASGLLIGSDGKISFAPGQTFPGTNNGTVTQVDTGAGLTGGPITSTGTISIATGGVTNTMLQNNSIGVIAGTGIGVTGTSSLGGSFTIANSGVLSFDGRNGLIIPQANDYSFAQLSGTDSATSNLVYNNQANLFTGGKQTLPASAAIFASLNFPNTGVTPSSPATGDVWLTSGDGHLQFQSAGGLKSLAFTTDIASGTVTGTGLSSGQLIVGNGSSAIKTGDLTGDVTTSGSTLTTLAATVAGAHTFSNAGNSFTGNGAGLTNLTAANIGAGTAGINITGNAATASTAATATTAGNVTGVVAIANGGTNATTASAARTNLGAAASGANTDITTMADVTSITSTGNLAISAAGDGAPFNLTLAGGSPITGSTNGGNVILNPGTGHGSGANGQVQVNGGLGLPGSTSGLVTVQPQAVAGTPTLTLPNTSGTFAVSATSPLVLNTTTGALTCPTCGTGSGTVTQVNTGAGLTGGGFTTSGTISVATGGVTNAMLTNPSVTLNTAGGLTGGGSLSLGGTLSLSTSATSANTASTLVSRDASGNFSAGTITASLNGNATTATSATTAASATTAGTATTAGNVTGIVAVANGGTGVNSSTTAANLVFASPTGASGSPTFRALTAADLPAGSSTPAILSGTCSGTATASSAGLGVFGLGEISALTCTVPTTAATHRGMVMPSGGTLKNLRALAGTAGANNGTSGSITVLVNNTATAITCKIGNGTTCNDTTHTAAVNAGDEVSVFFATANNETLADVRVSLEKQ